MKRWIQHDTCLAYLWPGVDRVSTCLNPEIQLGTSKASASSCGTCRGTSHCGKRRYEPRFQHNFHLFPSLSIPFHPFSSLFIPFHPFPMLFHFAFNFASVGRGAPTFILAPKVVELDAPFVALDSFDVDLRCQPTALIADCVIV